MSINEVGLSWDQLYIMDHMSSAIEISKGGFTHDPFRPGETYAAIKEKIDPRIELPEVDDTAHKCGPISLYYAAQYLDFDVPYQTIEKLTQISNLSLNHINSISTIVEMLGLEENIPIIPEVHMHKSANQEKDRRDYNHDIKIAEMAEEITLGSVLLVDINDPENLWGTKVEGQAPEERHAIMVFGFEVTESGVPVFHCIDHTIGQNHPIRIPARELMENSSLHFLAISREREETKVTA